MRLLSVVCAITGFDTPFITQLFAKSIVPRTCRSGHCARRAPSSVEDQLVKYHRWRLSSSEAAAGANKVKTSVGGSN